MTGSKIKPGAGCTKTPAQQVRVGASETSLTATIRTAPGMGITGLPWGSVVPIKELMWWWGNLKEDLFTQVVFKLGASALQGALVGPQRRKMIQIDRYNLITHL